MSRKRYLGEQLSFYAAYHSVRGNQLIHFVFIPVLLVTTLALILFIPFANYPLLRFEDERFDELIPINVCFAVFTCMYPLSYIYIDIESGLSWLPIAALSWAAANYLVVHYALSSIFAVWVLSWIAQFIGHGLIERRRPALLDSLYASIVLAPLFWWFECFLFPMGYYPEAKKEMLRNAKVIQKKLDQRKD